MPQICKIALGLGLLLCLWLLLVDGLAAVELSAGAAAALLAIVWGIAVVRAAEVRFRPSWKQLAAARKLPWWLLADTAVVMSLLLRPGKSRGRYVTFAAAIKDNDSRSCARRALIAAGVSFSPGSIVLGFDKEGGRVIVHQLGSFRRLGPGRREEGT